MHSHRNRAQLVESSCSLPAGPGAGRLLRSLVLALIIPLWCTPGAQAQSLTPLDEEATAPLSSPAVSEDAVEVFGKLAHLWRDQSGAEVMQFYGDFGLHMGRRRLRAHDAVVWMTEGQHDRRTYRQFEVYLWRDARVVEPAGTLSTGSALFVTLQSFGDVSLNFDQSTPEPATHSELYQEAMRVRDRFSPYRAPLSARESPVDVQRPSTTDTGAAVPRAARPVIIRPGRDLVSEVRDGERLIIASQGVYIAQAGDSSAEFMEIRAENAVMYAREETLQQQLDSVGRSRDEASLEDEDLDFDLPAADRDAGVASGMVGGAQGLGGSEIRDLLKGVYLEGDVILSRGDRQIRAERLYYDFENDRALILDAVMIGTAPQRNLPIYVRAKQVRQLSGREYVAEQAVMTTSEFATPHYSVGAEKVFLHDRTPGDEAGRVVGLAAGTYRAYHTTLNLEGVPILYWPYSEGDFKQSESVLKSVSVGYADDFGATFESKWFLSNLLGVKAPEGVDSVLLLDYFSERGPGVGVNIDYERDDYYGLFRGYYVNDHGEDNLGGYRDDLDVPHDNRGRALLRHRQYLAKGWELTLEASYISDDNFLESYFENEFDEGKAQETLLYLKKQEDNWAFTALAQWRILSWLTQTENLPDLGFFWNGQQIGDIATYFQESHVGAVRYRPDDRRLFDAGRWWDNTSRTDVVARGDTRHELDFPFSLGPVRVVPFVMARGTAWDDSPFDDSGLARGFIQGGVRSSMYLSRTYEDVENDLLDIHGLRHVIKPDVVAWVGASNVDSSEVSPFTEGIEDIDDFNGVMVGIRQRLQTRRGGPGRWRTVDWMTFDVEAGFFDNDNQGDEFTRGKVFPSRPENSITANYISANYIWRVSDTTALLSDMIYDANRGAMGSYNLSLAVERSPRLSYFIGYRYINAIESNLVGFGVNYKVSRKHTFAVRDYWDLDLGRNAGFELTYIRKWPRWYTAITFTVDDTQDRNSVSVSAWPEGLPNAAVGGRQYTGIAESVAIAQ